MDSRSLKTVFLEVRVPVNCATESSVRGHAGDRAVPKEITDRGKREVCPVLVLTGGTESSRLL